MSEDEKWVLEAATDMVKSGKLDAQIENIIVESIRTAKDKPLSNIGFILKMSIEIMDSSRGTVGFQFSKKLASRAFREFCRDNRISFGASGWDWSGNSARLIAREYETNYW